MLKVKVRLTSSGVAAASGALLLAGAPLGCAMGPDETGEEALGEAEEALTPGSGTLELDGFPGSYNVKLSFSTTDEFLRAGESLTMVLPVWLLWDKLYPGTPLDTDLTRLAKIGATLKVTSIDKTQAISTISVPVAGYSGGDNYSFVAKTKAFTVPSKADWISFEVSIADTEGAGATATILPEELPKLAIFGGELPKKSLYCDSVQSTKRQRVIEGDDPIAGSELQLVFTDWRADVIVDRSMIDTQIGKAITGTRFGMVEIPIYGRIEHQVSYGVYFDDGQGWRSEAPLTVNSNSRYLGLNRTTYEGNLKVPAKARRMEMYAHVKTYLVADYTPYSNITEKWYADNSSTLKADKYDNPNGAFTNYTFSVSNALP